jgi:Mg/Co/Ni transporter MgtE
MALLFAAIIGVVAGALVCQQGLGGIIAAAMVVNMLAAALAGILLPLLLDKVGADPAIASAVFVTTVTDVVGLLRLSRIGGMVAGARLICACSGGHARDFDLYVRVRLSSGFADR